MDRSDILNFWKLLEDAKFTGSPSKLTEDEVRKMVKGAGLVEPEIEAVLRGFRKFLDQED